MSIATGREAEAIMLLRDLSSSVQLVIPSVCYRSAWSAFEDELKRHNSFKEQLSRQISETKRDVTSQKVASLSFYLEESLLYYLERIDELELRLREAISMMSENAEMIVLNLEIIQSSLNTAIIKKDPTDNLILHCILSHARSHSTESKVFLSGNVKEFGLSKVRDALQEVGITKYFSRTEDFLGWLQSQS
ncbi:PIN domain-containing protein [Lyngbya sp. CCAP 1446/10]|uniref:PIN domain-containing protein n=1 Tax=Lyngbya sp. CCAP 1446/10 TaxID=439293 RepID=UPI002238546A|nr:PIN domain-containing protein [Lyngbya sp. CCAP 1446/10]MCW6052914.1 PIN domain-containing protein [Lyngbya sp. CCAP 1446/10]